MKASIKLFVLFVFFVLFSISEVSAACPPRSGFNCVESGNTYVYTSIAITDTGRPVETNTVYNASYNVSAIVDEIVDMTVTNTARDLPPASATVLDSTANTMTTNPTSPGSTSSSSNASASSGPIEIYTTEKIPGASCECYYPSVTTPGEDGPVTTEAIRGDKACGVNVAYRKYVCTVSPGMVSFQNMIRDITRWFVNIIMLLGVLALVGAGILWAMGSDSEEYTKKAKGWAKNIIIGLVILFTFRYILGFLAPWIFQ